MPCWTSCGPIKQIERARSVVYWTCQVNRLVKQSKAWACGFPRCFGMPGSYEEISGCPTTQTLFGSSRNLPPQRLCELRKECLHWRLISGRFSVLKQKIKRGCVFLSFLTSQVDVSGNCSSEYRIVKAKESEAEINKTRNLSNCTQRSHNITKLNPVMYGVNSVSKC